VNFFGSQQGNVTVLKADRQDCPVCGGKHGDCVGDSKYFGGINFIPKRPDDPTATFIVPKRIYHEVDINGKKVRRLLYAKGARVTPAEAQRLGLLPKNR
jgi:hypothetical protein